MYDPEKGSKKSTLDKETQLHNLRTVSSHTSAVEDALDAEAGLTPQDALPPLSAQKTPDIGPPPNGGLHAWLQVLGSFFLFFNSWGTVNTFGVFQTYYQANLLSSRTPSEISWIGSIQAFLLLLVGVLAGPIFDRGHFKALIAGGASLIPFGFMMTSLATQYWQIMLSQAVCIGIGNGLLFVPSVALLPQYFTTKKALANGFAAAGSSVGGVIYPIVFRELYPRVGFGWATRVLGFIALATSLVSVALMKVRIQPKTQRSLLELDAFQEAPYSMFVVAMFFGFLGFYAPVYYVQSYAIGQHITDVNFGFYLLPILNAASVPGRIVPNFIADKAGPMNVLVPASAATGILALCWIGIHNKAGIIIFALLYGFCSGGFVSMPPVAITSLTKDLRTLGTRMGQLFFISSFGLLIGTPVSGAIVGNTGHYLGLQLFSGITILITASLISAVRFLIVGKRLKVKV